jgi:hypothetical protein
MSAEDFELDLLAKEEETERAEFLRTVRKRTAKLRVRIEQTSADIEELSVQIGKLDKTQQRNIIELLGLQGRWAKYLGS